MENPFFAEEEQEQEQEQLQRETVWPESNLLDENLLHWYSNPAQGIGIENVVGMASGQNMNQRMSSSTATSNEQLDMERDRGYRHMISERLRREKEKQNYADLHSSLPLGTKMDKNSVVQMATTQVQELKNLKEELEKRNKELQKRLLEEEGEKAEVTTTRLRVPHPSSAVDSMVDTLRCLNNMGLNSRRIRSEFSGDEISAVIELQTKIEPEEVVQEAVKIALEEVERKSLMMGR